MNLLTLMPFIISAICGFCLLNLILPSRRPEDLPWQAAMSVGLGLGVSAGLAWTGFLFLQQFHKTYLIGCHVALLLSLLYFYNKNPRPLPRFDKKTVFDMMLAVLVLGFFLTVAWHFGQFYPLGGWDAWQVWNIKAKFLFLGGNHWKNMLQPSLWQTSPHYPLLLPLINVWGWTFQETASPGTPFLTAIIFTGLTAFLLWGLLYSLGKKQLLSLLPALLLLTHPFFITLATSQYADILFSFYLTAALSCQRKGLAHSNDQGYNVLFGVFLGILAFSKPEGTLLALQAFLLTVMMKKMLPGAGRPGSAPPRRAQGIWIASFCLAMMPTVIFNVFYSPGNQTFINGLSSWDHPASLDRLKMISAFLLMELKSLKWRGIWIFILAGLFLQSKACFGKQYRFFPGVLLIYLSSVLTYYYVNTYFEIGWWLQVSLHRILFTLLPAFLLWIFWPLSLKEPDTRPDEPA
ncbi:MAG: hypothetical protein KBB26_08820 [Candidatus Omnitrophica bacterium]|nr:hypothetical protein [Candidatus Omnitrophota bacterium]